MQSYQAVLKILNRYITTDLKTGIKSVKPEHRLQEDLGLDSVGLLSLAVEIENHFEIYLDEAPEEPPQTVHDVVTLILSRLREKG